MALRKVKTNIDRLFDKNLTDLVRGLRNNKDNESSYIANVLEELRNELKIDNINVKTNAVSKLTYLQMFGYDITFASFNIIETMSSNKFTSKRVGYLAASQCFHPGTDLLMLTTNTVKKDLSSVNQYDAGVALSGLSCFISTDLSRDLANDIMTLMSSTKPYLRMKAVLMMYKVFLNYPDALRPAFQKIKERLEDSHPGVQSAAVNVICELARKNPKNYLSLAPIFFKLMTTSTNNWMLIKIIKLFGALTPLEPRLGKKLIEPLTNLINNTTAMSLLYECINTVIAVLISISTGLPNHNASIQLCVQKLLILIQDSDQNLKYLGLLALGKILKTHPKSVSSHKDLILACLDDKDESIRLRALDLLYGMVSKKNLMEIVKRLLGHIERAEVNVYRDELLFKVIEICSQESYHHVTNFEWYITVIVELIQLEKNSKHGSLIADQLLDVAIRVEGVRQFAVSEMISLLDTFPIPSTNSSMYEVFYAAAWIVGEFGDQSINAEHALSILLVERPIPGHIQAVYVQNILKLYSNLMVKDILQNDYNQMLKRTNALLEKLPIFISSSDIEVQERASSANVMMEMIQFHLKESPQQNDLLDKILDDIQESKINPEISIELLNLVKELSFLYTGELNPVAKIAQRKVQLPEGLNLDAIINKSFIDRAKSSESSEAESYEEPENLFVTTEVESKYSVNQTTEEIEKLKSHRKQLQMMNPNYLKSLNSSNSNRFAHNFDDKETRSNNDLDDIPITELNLDVDLKVHSHKRSDSYLIEDKKSKSKILSNKKAKKSKTKRETSFAENSSDSDNNQRTHSHIVNTKIEMPDGAILSDNDEMNINLDASDPHRALNINFGETMLTESYNFHKKSKHKSKENKKNKEKKHKKSKKKNTEYEETLGISTPSKEIF